MLKELRTIPLLLNGFNPKELGIYHLKENRLSCSYAEKNRWLKSLREVETLLNELGIEYVLIKYLDIPFSYMQDVDLLVENERDRHMLFSALKRNGYKAYQSRFPPHPEKVQFIKPPIQVDIYPEPAWWKMSYAPVGLIPSKKTEKEILEERVFVPSPTHALYIIITHSYAHGIITLAELTYVTKLILDYQIEWSHLLSLARCYKLEHAVYVYLFLVNRVLACMEKRIPEIQRMLNELGQMFLSRRLNSIFLQVSEEDRHFPMNVPLSLRFLSGLREILVSSISGDKPTIRELSTYWLLVREELTKHYKRLI